MCFFEKKLNVKIMMSWVDFFLDLVLYWKVF
jgi:hypothetical protein